MVWRQVRCTCSYQHTPTHAPADNPHETDWGKGMKVDGVSWEEEKDAWEDKRGNG